MALVLVEINGVFINPEHVTAVAPLPDDGKLRLATEKRGSCMIWVLGGPQQNIKVEGSTARDVSERLTRNANAKP